MIRLQAFNLYPAKILAGVCSSLAAVFVGNLLPLFCAVVLFEAVDFVTGIVKSYVLTKREGRHFAFESIKAWRTIYKFVFILVGICMAEALDATISEERLRLANFFTAFCCGVEFWSFLENAAAISQHPVFRWLKKFMKIKVEDTTGVDLDEEKLKEDN